jgi:hypothetical protein
MDANDPKRTQQIATDDPKPARQFASPDPKPGLVGGASAPKSPKPGIDVIDPKRA